jgi:RNA polymerase sigma-70 factor (ECF subfamily)
MAEDIAFETLVEKYYRPLYHFAFSLTASEADAWDLTQQTFLIWAAKRHQLRDSSKAKTWLFTTLHREFLHSCRHFARFPHRELDEDNDPRPPCLPDVVNQIDAATALKCLAQVDQQNKAPLALFYLDSYSYQEIADILDIPLGTVRSRIFRGKAQLVRLMCHKESEPKTIRLLP